MRSISDYLDTAKAISGIESDTQLAARLGVSQPQIAKYRKGFVFPTDATMVRIADLGHLDAPLALLQLNLWRSEKVCQPLYHEVVRAWQHKIGQEEKPTARTAAE